MIRYLFVPEVAPGRGSGHLVRCLELARILPGSAFIIPPGRQEELKSHYPALADFRLFPSLPALRALPDGELPLAVLDRMEISLDLVRQFLPATIPIAIDARGEGLRLVPLVVDLLPRLRSRSAWDRANRWAPEYLPQPKARRSPPAGPLPAAARILVSFGGEDPAGLGQKLATSGHLARCFPEAEVWLLSGPLSAGPERLPPRWHAMPPVPVLREELHRYDLVVTSFGLTAYEARSAGCRVLLCNPSAYHEALTKRAGFASLGVGIGSVSRFRKALLLAETAPVRAPAEEGGLPALAGWLAAIPKTMPCSCPGCRTVGNPVIARFADRSYFRCQGCGLDYLASFRVESTSYDESYFFTDYQKQYGKTYLDDFAHIKAMGGERLDALEKLVGRGLTAATLSRHRAYNAPTSPSSVLSGMRLLDVGCAYGPFLAAAAERGILVHGTDISDGALAHVRGQLGFPAVAGDIRALSPDQLGGPFELVTLWYVIEHFPDLDRVLSRLSELLVPGGWLALSTPSGEGISSRRDQVAFLKNSPADHFTVWNPSKAANLLARYGLELRHIRVTGHHPERFPGLLGLPPLRWLGARLSQRFGLGDTFELYAVKTANPVTGA